MCCIPFQGVTGGEPPAILSISFIMMGILHAIQVVDQGMIPVMLPVI
jgi:hypothetical protein